VYKTKVLNAAGAIDDKYDATIFDIYGIEQYLIDFKSEREGKADRKYGYSPKNKLDSLENELLTAVSDIVKDAKKLLEDKQPIEASIKIQEIFDNVFEDFDMIVEQDPNFVGYSIQISPMLRDGLSEFILNTPGNIKMRAVTAEENINRRNYRVSDNIDYLDGDLKSSIHYPGSDQNKLMIDAFNSGQMNEDWAMYQSGRETKLNAAGSPTTLVSDKSMVYKGASWRDRAYYLNPGTRRFLDRDRATATIGFRCAMDRVGSPVGLGMGR